MVLKSVWTWLLLHNTIHLFPATETTATIYADRTKRIRNISQAPPLAFTNQNCNHRYLEIRCRTLSQKSRHEHVPACLIPWVSLHVEGRTLRMMMMMMKKFSPGSFRNCPLVLCRWRCSCWATPCSAPFRFTDCTRWTRRSSSPTTPTTTRATGRRSASSPRTIATTTSRWWAPPQDYRRRWRRADAAPRSRFLPYKHNKCSGWSTRIDLHQLKEQSNTLGTLPVTFGTDFYQDYLPAQYEYFWNIMLRYLKSGATNHIIRTAVVVFYPGEYLWPWRLTLKYCWVFFYLFTFFFTFSSPKCWVYSLKKKAVSEDPVQVVLLTRLYTLYCIK